MLKRSPTQHATLTEMQTFLGLWYTKHELNDSLPTWFFFYIRALLTWRCAFLFLYYILFTCIFFLFQRWQWWWCVYNEMHQV